MTHEIDRSPARLSAALSMTAAAIAAGAAALATPFTAPLGFGGLLATVVGVQGGHRRAVTVGAGLLVLAAVAGGLVTPNPLLLLTGFVAAVLAWDVGEQAINVGEQLGRAAETAQLEVVHAAASAVVALGGAGLGWARLRWDGRGVDASERRREFLRQMSPWFGFMAAAAAVALGFRAIAAGYVGDQPLGYPIGALELLVGYVAARRAWDGDLDAVFVAGVVAVVAVSVASIVLLDLPPTVYEEAT